MANYNFVHFNEESIEQFWDDIFNNKREKKNFKRLIKNNIKPTNNVRYHHYGDWTIAVEHPSYNFTLTYKDYDSIGEQPASDLANFIGCWSDSDKMEKALGKYTQDGNVMFTKRLF